jgi:FkbM family methyltransferase
MHKALKKIRIYHSLLGIRGVAAFLFAKSTGTRPVFKKDLKGITHPVFVRIGTTDLSVLAQVFVERHYDVPLSFAPKVIVDAGANIGLSAVFFANKYPDARIIAIEPEEANFQMLERNVARYPQIKPLRAALWKENGQISLFDPGCGDHGFRVGENNVQAPQRRGVIQALTVDGLLEQSGFDHADILKIDIEGAEKEVFECSAKWIGKVGVVMAELHDQIKPGCQRAFSEATKEFPKKFTSGETFVCSRTPA